MATARERALIVKVARMYYEQNMSQDQIARALLTSRSNVSRILSVAKQRGIVEIKIIEEARRETEIEELLMSRFGLRGAMVAKVPRGTSDYKAVGQLAVGSFLNHLKPRVRVAVSWGRSIQAMVDALEPESRPDLTFIPIMGHDRNSIDSLGRGADSLAGREVQCAVPDSARPHDRAVARYQDCADARAERRCGYRFR